MKVKRLIEILNSCDPNAEVIISEDPEGNGYGRLHENSILQDAYGLDTYELQVYDKTDLSEVAGYDRLNLFKAVVLYP